MSEVKYISESMVQDALYKHLWGRFSFVFPNMDVITMYEADIVAISRAGYAYEYEIKLSPSDFRADLKKREKHASLCGAVRKMIYPYPWGHEREMYVMRDAPENVYAAMRCRCYPEQRPKEFWYVVYGFEVPEQNIPGYAGLMRYIPDKKNYYSFEIIKQAPKLPAQKVDEKRIVHATSNMLHRYWSLRLKETLL